jgi:hypothetical protein
MILQQLTNEELDALDQMARTSPGYQVLVDYLLRCMNTGAISACYNGGEESIKQAGAVIGFRHLATTLLNARNSKEEVNRAIEQAQALRNRDVISP